MPFYGIYIYIHKYRHNIYVLLIIQLHINTMQDNNYTMTIIAIITISVDFKELARFSFVNTLGIISYTFISQILPIYSQ